MIFSLSPDHTTGAPSIICSSINSGQLMQETNKCNNQTNNTILRGAEHYLFIHQQNGSIAQNVDSEGMTISTNGVIKKDRNNKWYDETAPWTSTNLLIYKMDQSSRL